ncbi:MAG: MATE family efflux transporter [Acidimicrobiales bacterium]
MGARFDPLDRRIIALALPALGALIVEPLYTLTDSAIVGHLGKLDLGGLAVATSSLNVLAWTAAFLEMATVSVVAFRRSAGDEAGAGRAVGAAYLLSGVVGVVTTVLVELLAPVMVEVLGGSAHGAIAVNAIEYLRISAVGMAALFVALAGNGHLTGLADTRRPLVIALLSNAVNLVAEVALVYGAHLGIAGSAWGTVLAQVVAAVLFVRASRAAPVVPRRPGSLEIRQLVSDAVPLTVRTIALGSALLATTAVAARLGASQLGGHQIALQIWNMLALTLDSLAVPAQVYVSEALGAGDLGAARDIGHRTLRMGLFFGVFVGVVTMALSGELPRIFSPNAAVDRQAMLALLVCGLQQPLAAAAFVLDGLVLGASQYATMRRAMLLALIAFTPLVVLTLAVHGVGILGIWLAMLCWLAARTGLLGRRWRAIVAGAPSALPGAGC